MTTASEAKTQLQQLVTNITSVVLGKIDVVRLGVIALLADGHILLEDVPGVGKTLLAKAFAKSIDASFHRVQFTPDLLPADLLGTNVLDQKAGEFRFMPGPLFSQVVLADEVNRATPRTQSALLEAMAERQITVDGLTRTLQPPFFVIATQNPYEFEGTYPLPESQLDRFLIRTELGYPDRQAERDLLIQHRMGEPVDKLPAVLSSSAVASLQELVRTVQVSDAIADYILDIVEATRKRNDIVLGASTRAALGLYRAAQAAALYDGRDYLVPDDVKNLAVPCLAHRIVAKSIALSGTGDLASTAIKEILQTIEIPT